MERRRMDTIFLIFLAVIGGIAITLQGQFMGLLDQAMGTRESVFITYGSGGALIAVYTLFRAGSNLHHWREIPPYAFTTGILGLVIVGTIGYVVPRLGVANGFTLLVASEFIAAAVIDSFGLFGAEMRPLGIARALGLIIILLGVWLVVRR
jgi:transporter family-2 protein